MESDQVIKETAGMNMAVKNTDGTYNMCKGLRDLLEDEREAVKAQADKEKEALRLQMKEAEDKSKTEKLEIRQNLINYLISESNLSRDDATMKASMMLGF